MAAQPKRRLFDVREYYKMGKAGILKPDERVELIEGEIIQMPAIGVPHASHVNRLNNLLFPAVRGAAQVVIQNPIHLSQRSEPVPDVMLVRPKPDFYASGHPTAGDVLLLIEVSDTSLPYDRRIKLPLYARENVPEVWVLDVRGEVLGVHQEPTPNGYRINLTLERGDRVAPAAFPHVEFAVDDILG
jgi:hypothetical protein